MKSDFVLAITQLAAEKNLPKEVVLGAVETALVSAYRKDSFVPEQEIKVRIEPSNGRVTVWAEKKVVEKVTDSRCEISVVEAKKIDAKAKAGDLINVEATPHDAGRIAAQTAKQVILQRLHEAESSAVLEEYADKEGDIVSGVVQRIESRQIIIDLGRAEAVMPQAEQVPTERYRIGQRLKVYLLEVARIPKGPMLIVSRSHPNLLRRLFELEVPEVYNGTVEIKAVAREAGSRSKVAVATAQQGIDPVGCCVGLRGIRIQNIVSELNGEKIDVVAWSEEPGTFIASALSPAQVVRVDLDQDEKSATVIIPDRQLSLAIGKEGQNVRLAVRLSGWRIDIKSASSVEAEKEEAAEVEAAAEKPLEEEPAVILPEEPVVEEAVKEEKEEEVGEVVPLSVLESAAAQEKEVAEKPKLRFAEDIMPSVVMPKPESKTKKKKKKNRGKDSAEDGIKLKKRRKGAGVYEDEEEL